MRRVRYNVAASLDGYIAGPQGEFDWIPMDPSVDFASLFANVDTVLLGRRSYDAVVRQGGSPPWAPEAQVDAVEITLVPILLGGGVPLLQPGAPRTVLTLTGTRVYPSGLVSLSYAVQSPAAEPGVAGDVRPGTVPE
jgi:dihydrofolate reductase